MQFTFFFDKCIVFALFIVTSPQTVARIPGEESPLGCRSTLEMCAARGHSVQ